VSGRSPGRGVSTFAALAVLGCIAVRPLVDLTGRYDGSGMNLGGLVGIAATAAAVLHFLTARQARPALVLVAVLTWASLVVSATIVLLHHGVPDVSALGRLLVGFSPLLIVAAPRDLVRTGLDRAIKVAALVVVLASVVPFVIAWAQLGGWIPYTYFDYLEHERIGRPSGGYHQPNSLARLAVFAFIILMTLAHHHRIRLSLRLVATTVLGATLAITTHRTSMLIFAWIVLTYGILGLVWGLVRRPVLRLGVRQRVVGTAALASGMGALALTLLVMSGVGSRLTATLEQSAAVVTYGLTSALGVGEGFFLRGRGAIWSAAMDLYRESGALGMAFGHGFEPLEAHNDVLRVLLMHGAVGVAAFVLLFVALFAEGLRRTDLRGRATLCILFAYLVLFGVPLHPTAYPFFMWLFFLTYLLVLVVHGSRQQGGSAPASPTAGWKALGRTA
jgi:O-antigen ligase